MSLCGDITIASIAVAAPPGGFMSMCTYGPAPAKSQMASAPCAWRRAVISSVSQRSPVTFEPAEKAPTLSGRAVNLTSSSVRCSMERHPRSSVSTKTTSASDSRHGSRFEWCSMIEIKTMGRSADGTSRVKALRVSCSVATIFWTAEVEPEPVNVITSSGPQLSDLRTRSRASCESRLISFAVNVSVEWVFA
eukprot:Amastigsp_a174496_138.p3 type:complete len:192 gc:universal Amastigsp_a174496_138:1091-1666(+)